jgi:hypothetical protein
MKVSRPILLVIFFYSAIFVLFPSSPYNIWKWVDQFCWLFFSTQQYSFSFLHLHIIYESESTILLGFFLYSPVLDFLAKFLYFVWKWVDQFCWLFFSTQQYSFFSLHLHTMYESESTNFADFFFTQQYSFFSLHLHTMYESESTNFADFFFLLSNIRFSKLNFYILYESESTNFADYFFYTQQFSIFQTKFSCFVWNSVNLYDDYFFCNI